MTHPNQYTAMAWHQCRSGGKTDDGDGWYKPEAWDRPEFREGNLAKCARGLLAEFLLDTPVALAHIAHIVYSITRPGGRPPGRPAGEPDLESVEGVHAVRMVSAWLDEALYGQGRSQFPRDERYPLQVTADSMARGDFCRMDFRQLVADCLEVGVEPRPITPGRRPPA